jgi:hypothetical protein
VKNEGRLIHFQEEVNIMEYVGKEPGTVFTYILLPVMEILLIQERQKNRRYKGWLYVYKTD